MYAYLVFWQAKRFGGKSEPVIGRVLAKSPHDAAHKVFTGSPSDVVDLEAPVFVVEATFAAAAEDGHGSYAQVFRFVPPSEGTTVLVKGGETVTLDITAGHGW